MTPVHLHAQEAVQDSRGTRLHGKVVPPCPLAMASNGLSIEQTIAILNQLGVGPVLDGPQCTIMNPTDWLTKGFSRCMIFSLESASQGSQHALTSQYIYIYIYPSKLSALNKNEHGWCISIWPQMQPDEKPITHHRRCFLLVLNIREAI